MRNIYKELKLVLIIVGAISVVTLAINIFYRGSLDWDTLWKTLMFNVYYGVPLSLVNGYFFDYLSLIMPWDEHPRKRAFWGVVGSITLTMITLIVLNTILWVYIWGNEIDVLWNRSNRSFYIVGLVITIIVSISIHAIGFFKEVQREKVVSQKLRQEKLAMELNALRSHVDPHFLFNSFNVLSGLIDEDADKAQDFLAGLSKIYRYILEQRNEDTSSVGDELDFAQKYIELQKMRFEDSIDVETRIGKEALSKKVPSLSLQLLLENAIKHNGFSIANPLKIIIAEEDGALVVSNTIRHRKQIAQSAGMGLQNISDRYYLLSKRQIIIDTNDEMFTVKLPLI